MASYQPEPAPLPDCPTGRQIVGWLNANVEKHGRVGGGLLFANGVPVQKVMDAINSPKTELGIEIPFFPWSDEPTYCAGTRQRDGAVALVVDMEQDNAAADAENERREKVVTDWFRAWWSTLWTSVKIALVLAVVVLAAWVVRSFRSVA